MELTLRGLEAVLAVHHTQHFGRAAARLGVPTSTLSEQVAAVERRLGEPLFHRTSREVVTTPFGLEVVARAELVVAAYAGLRAWAEDRTAAGGRRLRIGVVTGLDRALVAQVIRATSDELTGWTVDVHNIGFRGAEPALLTGELDVALTPGPVSLDRTDLRGTEVWHEPRALMVARSHPLAQRESVQLADLAGEPVVTTGSEHPAARWWAVDPRPDGSPVRYGPPARDLEEVVHQVAAGRGVNLTAASAAQSIRHPDVVYVALVDAEPATVWVLARAGERSWGVQVAEEAARRLSS